MPRRRRLSPGQQYGSGGGGLDLGGLLQGIFGGVMTDDTFVSAGDAEAADMLGGAEMVGKNYQTNAPYKAKSIFDRNETRRMNAAYNADSIEAENDIARALRKEQGLNPILKGRLEDEYSVKSEYDKGRDAVNAEDVRRKHELALEEAARKQVLAEMSKLGIPYTENNFNYVTQKMQNQLQERAAANVGRDTSEANLGADTADFGLELLGATKGSNIIAATANANAAAQNALFKQQNAGRYNNLDLSNAERDNALKEILMKTQSIYGSPESGAFDINTGQVILEAKPDMLNPGATLGSRIPKYRSVPNPRGTRVVDPMSGEVLGNTPTTDIMSALPQATPTALQPSAPPRLSMPPMTGSNMNSVSGASAPVVDNRDPMLKLQELLRRYLPQQQ